MTSKIKVDNINKVSDDSNIIKKCGSTTTVGSGSGQTIVVDGATVTLGRCGGAVNLASGASQTGFGRTGTVNWCTTVKTSPLTVSSGNGYFVNTTGGEITVTLPASPSAGDIVSFKDYANTWDSNKVTVGRNGSKIGGVCGCGLLSAEGQSVTLIYVDSTRGWLDIQDSTANVVGTIPYDVQYLVVAGGGGGSGGTYGGGGGGGGGYRTVCSKNFSIAGGQNFPITVGAGAPGISACSATVRGANSVFSTITSTGGGGGTTDNMTSVAEATGGSGGGTGGGGGGPGGCSTNHAGNTPPVSPPQGQPGGNALVTSGNVRSGGGGGATGQGQDGAPLGPNTGGNGGAGATTAIFGSIPQAPSYGTPGPAPGRYFSGGGSGRGGFPPSPGTNGTGGVGGGGSSAAQNGTTNTGGGAAGQHNGAGGTGGSGIVVIRHATADATPTTSGGNVVATCGSDTIRIFTADGTFVS